MTADSKRGWVFYDDSCGFCAWWVPRWEWLIRRAGYQIAPLQDDWVADALGISRDRLIDDLRMLEPDGSRRAGADVYIQVLSRVWWTWPLSVLFRIPFIHALFWGGYRWFNRHRYQVSKACGLSKTRP